MFETLKNKTKNKESHPSKETKTRVTSLKLGILKDETDKINTEIHIVKQWENIWRIIYEFAKKNAIKPIKPENLEWISITPWDKVILNFQKIIVEYQNWNQDKTIYFEINDKKEDTPKISKKTPNKVKKTINKKESKKWPLRTDTIFDWNSPIKWDKIAYDYEVKFRNKFYTLIKKLVNKYLKWSVISENLIYSIIAKESQFNPSSKSYTWVRWLAQITQDTIETVYNINNAKVKKNQKNNDLYITSEITSKNWEIDYKKALNETYQLKLMISYLIYLESLFEKVKNKDLKIDLIILSYNLWPNEVKRIVDIYPIRSWHDIIKNTKADKEKKKESTSYISDIKKIMLAMR